MAPFSLRDSNQRAACTFSQSEPTRLLSSQQGASLSQQHRRRCHRIQGPYRQYPQVPTVSLMPCATLLNTAPTHITHDETQRVATKPDYHQQGAKLLLLYKFLTILTCELFFADSDTVCYVMFASSSSLSLTPLKYLARFVLKSFYCCLCVIVF